MTLSSQDEWFAESFSKEKLDTSVIISQLDLISKAIEFFKDNNDWFLIIRPHPREFPNKRENNSSSHGIEIQEYFNSLILPPNIVVDYPEKRNSLYQLISVSDYVYNVLSSVGAESAALGVPVLSVYTEQFSAYPRELNIYLKNDLSGLAASEVIGEVDPQTLSKVAFRWYHFRYFKVTTSKYKRIPKFIFILTNISRGFYVKYNLSLSTFILKTLFLFTKRFHKNSRFRTFSAPFRFQSVRPIKRQPRKTLSVYNRLAAQQEMLFLRFFSFLIRRSIFRIYD
jgi:hypothetical protein